MLENTHDQFSPAQGGANGELQAIAWPALVARLAAQRDLRRVFMNREDTGRASFNAGAAAWLARGEAQDQRLDQRLDQRDAGSEQGKRDVNREALGDGKQACATIAGAANGAAEGDRETL